MGNLFTSCLVSFQEQDTKHINFYNKKNYKKSIINPYIRNELPRMQQKIKTKTNIQRSYSKKIQIICEQLGHKDSFIDELKKQLILKNQQIKQKNNELQNKQVESSNKLNDEIVNLKQQISQINKIKFSRCFEQYFSGQILNINEKDLLQWFVQTLQQKSKKQIRRTKFLYRMDLRNSQNFHYYFDEHPHVVFLVKLKNGNFIAAYSAEPFSSKNKQSYTESYLFSITNKRVFSPKSKDKVGINQSSITWDTYFAIFGNYQFRIKTGEAKIYSLFSMNNGFFDNQGQKLQILFGKGVSKKEVEIQTYQIFQVQWNQ